MKYKNLAQVADLFIYDETSPSGIRWKRDVSGGEGTARLAAVAGDSAGSKSKVTGYWAVVFEGDAYRVHRIVMALNGVYLSEKDQVDHIDGDRGNNTFSNLRVVTARGNAQNAKKFSTNTSGVTGVGWSLDRGRTYAVAYYSNADKKLKTTKFWVGRYGLLPAFRLACMWREEKIEEMNLLGQDYTDRHGK